MYPPPFYETRAVLASAYKGGPDKARLTHVVLCDGQDGPEIRVLCRRVQIDHLADRHATDADAAATCPMCAKRDPRPANL